MLKRVRDFWIKHPWIIAFLLATQFITAPPGNATGNVVFSALRIACSQHTGADVYGHRYIAGTNGEITAINVLIAAGVVDNSTYKANFPSATLLIMANNGSSAPNTTLATFTADTMTGVNARFIGSYSLTAGTKFWVVPGQKGNVFPDCFNFSTAVPNANVTFTKGWRLDTVTSTSWPYVNGGTPSTLLSPVNSNMLFPISIEIAPSPAATVSLSLQSGGNTAIYRDPTTVRATASSDGRVSFLQGGKPISGCRNVPTASLVATCTWRPALHGMVGLSARITPTDTSIPSGTSSVFITGVSARSNTR